VLYIFIICIYIIFFQNRNSVSDKANLAIHPKGMPFAAVPAITFSEDSSTPNLSDLYSEI